jgi:hypothetical protein
MTLSAPPISWTDSPHCEQCGYDLRALTEPRCPECGKPFDPAAAPVPNIPWLHRQVIGTFPAYWETVLLATFLPVKFAHEIWGASRVQTWDAGRFRRTIVAQAVVSTVLFVAAGIAENVPVTTLRTIATAVVVLLGVAIGAAVFFGVATELPESARSLARPHAQGDVSVWLHALHQYACAPLAALPLTLGACYAIVYLHPPMTRIFVLAVLLIQGLAWLWCTLVLLWSATRCDALSALSLLVTTPLTWLLWGIIAMVAGSAIFMLLHAIVDVALP